MPEFDFSSLQQVSRNPCAAGQQAHVYSAIVPAGAKAGRVALKVLKRALAAQDAERQAFVREVRLLGRVDHPNVVEAFGVGTTPDGLPCVLLSWCPETVESALRLDAVDCDPEVRSIVRKPRGNRPPGSGDEVAATPRPGRSRDVETSRGDAAAGTRISPRRRVAAPSRPRREIFKR